MDVLMPQLGETVAEGKITKWFKAAGDKVAPGENLFEIETDKTSMEVPATEAGVLAEMRVAAGEIAPVGAVVAVIAGDGAAVTPSPARAAAATGAAPRPAPAASAATPVAAAIASPPPPRGRRRREPAGAAARRAGGHRSQPSRTLRSARPHPRPRRRARDRRA